MTAVRTDRQRAVAKAVKVFRQGVSTPHSGEKRKCLQVLLRLVEPHHVMLSELDPSLPRRWDKELLEVRIGLAGITAPPAGTAGRSGRQHPSGPGTSGARGSPYHGTAAHQGQDHSAAAADFEVLLFQHLDGPERTKLLHGPRFSQGLLQAIGGTSAYPRLLAEAHALDVSNLGVRLGDLDLVRWLERILSRQGSRIKCRQGTQTIFDDLVSYCRFEYVTHTHQQRQSAQREQTGEEERRVNEARRQAAEARRERERKAACQHVKHDRSRQPSERESSGHHTAGAWSSTREPARRATGSRGPSAGTSDKTEAFTRVFGHLAEARLYLKVARLQVGMWGSVRSFTRSGQFVVVLMVPPEIEHAVDLSYHRALEALQGAAERIRTEAAGARDEAIRQAESVYADQCEQAFQIAADRYAS